MPGSFESVAAPEFEGGCKGGDAGGMGLARLGTAS